MLSFCKVSLARKCKPIFSCFMQWKIGVKVTQTFFFPGFFASSFCWWQRVYFLVFFIFFIYIAASYNHACHGRHLDEPMIAMADRSKTSNGTFLAPYGFRVWEHCLTFRWITKECCPSMFAPNFVLL